MVGIVELVNEVRSVFCVRCSDGRFGYFHAHPGLLPRAGETVEFDEQTDPPGVVRLPQRSGRPIAVFSAILHLPRHAAVMLVS